MTIDEHLRTIIGDQVLTIAKLAAEIDALRAQLAQQQQTPAPAAPLEDPPP